MVAFGFVQSKSDHSLFTLTHKDSFTALLVYVDDIVLAGTHTSVLSHVKEFLSSKFKLKDLGTLKYFLGLEIARNSTDVYINQRKCTLDILHDTGLQGSKPSIVPIEQNHSLSADQGVLMTDSANYRRLVGRLIYLTITRPDIFYVVHILSQYMSSPRVPYLDAATKLVKYLKGTAGQGLFFPTNSSLSLIAFCDADWATCKDTRRSISGYCVLLGNSLISWKCKRQHTVFRSSAEAEYRSMANVCWELTWLKSILHDFKVLITQPISLYCDNEAALHIASNLVFHERTKHIEIDCHLVRDLLVNGVITTCHLPTSSQPADLFTKALSSIQLQQHLVKLGVCNLFHTNNLQGGITENDSNSQQSSNLTQK